jgi:hypothetical protein
MTETSRLDLCEDVLARRNEHGSAMPIGSDKPYYRKQPQRPAEKASNSETS